MKAMRTLAFVAICPALLATAGCNPAIDAAPAPTVTEPPAVPLAPASPWPKFRRDAAQDGRTARLPETTGGVFWDFQTGKGVFSSPIVGADGTVYVGSADQNFYAIAKDGALRWKIPTGEIIDSSGLLDDRGRIYFGSGDGLLRACDAATGEVAWTFAADPPSVNSAYINWFEGNVAIGPDGTLYVPDDNYFVYALDRDTGGVAWRFKTPDQTWSLPAVDPATGDLYLGNNELLPLLGKNTFALTKGGATIWEASTLGTIAASPVLTADGTVILGGFDGFVHAYAAADGTPLWSTATRDHVYASPATLADGTVIQPSADGSVYALDPATGDVIWEFDTPEPIRSSPAVDGAGDVYVGGGDGTLYVLGSDGALRWSMLLIDQDRQNLNASPALGEDAVYIGGESGEVFSVPYDYCLRPMAQSDPRCSTTPPPTGPDDGASLIFTKPFGGLAFTPPAAIDANQALAFSLRVRQGGRTQLAILDAPSVMLTVTPAAQVTVDVAGDGKFVTITPVNGFTPDANGNVTLSLSSQYLVDLTRDGLAVSGGTVGGTVTGTFTFSLGQPATYPLALPTPENPGDPAGVFELYRISLPYPTILPSYNQIGFDSLHYLVGLVEGGGGKGVAWMAGAVLPEGKTDAVIDPTTQTLLPLSLTYAGGLLTLANDSGLEVDVTNVLIPLDTFRVSAHLQADGTSPAGAYLSGSTVCAQIPTYGQFLEQLGFCNPETDVLTVFGGANFEPYAGGIATAPAGLGAVAFSATASSVTATLTGSSLKLADHVASVLLIDAATGDPVNLSYGPVTQRTATPGGALATVSVPLGTASVPKQLRTYLLIDTYPAARGSVTLP
jgi:outer membrane protein assembly factor BamB